MALQHMEHVSTNLDHEIVDPQSVARRTPHGIGKVTREILETVILTLLIFFLVRANVQNFKVEGSSMEPNLHNAEYLLVNKAVYFNLDTEEIRKLFPALEFPGRKVIYFFKPPERGDVIVFRFPRDPSRDFIKRVIGVPGDVVEIRDGVIMVNGARVNEPYIKDRPNYTYPERTVPPDQYFVLGDNRNNSSDSHVWDFVPRENIVGKAWFVYWPFAQLGPVPNFELVVAPPAQRR